MKFQGILSHLSPVYQKWEHLPGLTPFVLHNYAPHPHLLSLLQIVSLFLLLATCPCPSCYN